jgi:hypothetical protein
MDEAENGRLDELSRVNSAPRIGIDGVRDAVRVIPHIGQDHL